MPQDVPTKKSLWILSQGSYSEYAVLGACSTEEEANRLANAYNKIDEFDEDVEVEVVPLFDGGQVTAGLSMSAQFQLDGTPRLSSRIYAVGPWGDGRPVNVCQLDNFLRVTGADPERVRKVFGDRLRAMKARRDLVDRSALERLTPCD